jgi:hypothetical protein
MHEDEFVMPSSDKAFPLIPMGPYERHQSEISLLMSHFFVGYLRDLYRHFDGDLALVIVLGEIAHHNTADHFSVQAGAHPELTKRLTSDEALRKKMPTCNAYSLAAATGMPRETIRRKIATLEKLGWVERADRKEVRITTKVGEHFQPDFNLSLLSELFKTVDRIRGLLSTPT